MPELLLVVPLVGSVFFIAAELVGTDLELRHQPLKACVQRQDRLRGELHIELFYAAYAQQIDERTRDIYREHRYEHIQRQHLRAVVLRHVKQRSPKIGAENEIIMDEIDAEARGGGNVDSAVVKRLAVEKVQEQLKGNHEIKDTVLLGKDGAVCKQRTAAGVFPRKIDEYVRKKQQQKCWITEAQECQ